MSSIGSTSRVAMCSRRECTRTGGRCGTPDILACVPPEGRFLAIELKVAGGRLEPAQATEIERIRAAGGCAIVAYSMREVG